MHTKLYLLLAATLQTSALFAMWGNPVMEPQEKELTASYKENSIKVSLEKDFGQNHVVKAAIFDNQLGEWELPVNLSPADLNAKKYLLATDPKGNAAVMWLTSDEAYDLIQISLFSRETNTWSTIKDLCYLKTNFRLTYLGMDKAGNVFASWKEKEPTHDVVWTITYSKEQDTWSRPEMKKMVAEDEDGPHVLLDNTANSLIVRDKKTMQAFVVPVEQAPLDLLQKALK